MTADTGNAHDIAPLPFNARPRFDAEAQALVGSRCTTCDAVAWPARSACAACGSDAVAVETLPQTGLLRAWSRVWVSVEGLQPPYDVGMVTVGGTQVFTHVRGVDTDTELPTRVRFVVDLDQHPPFIAVVDSEGE